MKPIVTFLRQVLPALYLFIATFSLQAQKLPRIQQGSLFAPPSVAVDGKAREWNNKFQAFNNRTEVFYSISNDLNTLYIALQATNQDIVKKIILGGITFSLRSSNEKQKNVAITYPVYDKSYPALYLSVSKLPLTKKDTLRNRKLSDSIMNAHNNKLQTRLKLIEVLGVKQIEDSILSVYNEEGIKAAALLDYKQALTYEIGIPLKYLGIDVSSEQKVYYNIKLNGNLPAKSTIRSIQTARGEIFLSVGSDGQSSNLGLATSQNMVLGSPTDFSGEYALATK